MIETKWVTKPGSEAEAVSLAEASGLSLTVSRILSSRGLCDTPSVNAFLNPRLSTLSDPFAMAGIQKGAERVADAIRSRQKILIYGDYDADGVTATALVCRVLAACKADVRYFLPDRFDDGYGLNKDSLLKAIGDSKPDVIITVDCGTASVEAAEVAAGMGIDVIVTDHHKPSEKNAPAYALINPCVSNDLSASNLSGVGVAFKLCHGIIKLLRPDGEPYSSVDLKEYFDLVALGTVADVVELSGENRIFVRYGLERIASGANIGIKALMKCAGMKPASGISTYHIGFVLGPRINAAGRMGKADLAVKLLMTGDSDEAEYLAGELEDMNAQRRSVEDGITKAAHAMIEEKLDELGSSIVVAGDGWHEGVIGIVSSRLTGRYYRPSAVISCDSDHCKGSCRSVEEVDLFEVLKGCGDLLLNFGGHRQAGGFSIKRNLIPEFRKRFEECCAGQMKGLPSKTIEIDAWVQPTEIDDVLYQALCRMEPFGEGNEEPVLALKGVTLNGPPRILKDAHVKMSISSGKRYIDAIAFGLAHKKVPDGPIDIAFTLDENDFNGRVSLQLLVKDYRKSE